MKRAGVVCAPQPLAVEAGVDTLKRGGNAIDAAIACAFVQGVVDPQMCGLGGGGVMMLHQASSARTIELSFYAPAPLAATATMFEPLIIERVRWGGWRLKDRANEVGYQSVCTPTFVKAADKASRQYGRLAWPDLLGPAIEIASAGAPVFHHVHDRWMRPTEGYADSIERHSVTPAAAQLYTRDGRMLATGERMRTDELAATLKRLASHGADDFYRGQIAAAIVSDMRAHGGLINSDDLERCEVLEREPLWGSYRNFRIAAPSPPGGGLALLLALRLLESRVATAGAHNGALHAHRLAECLKLGLATWKLRSGDPRFVRANPSAFLSETAVRNIGSYISDERALKVGDVADNLVPDSRDTTQVSVMDAQGNAVSMTHTLGLGSGVVTPGLGFMYNNAMMLFDPNPGQPNSISPGRIRQHATAASIALESGLPKLAIGAPGGHGIISGVVQTLSNLIDFGMTPTEAVSAARLHCEDDNIELEARFPTAVARALEELGHPVRHSMFSYDYTSGRPHVVRAMSADLLDGGADPRGGGMALHA
jgi:gamma-glutamyltranspeptidase/glutathione hydrolase